MGKRVIAEQPAQSGSTRDTRGRVGLRSVFGYGERPRSPDMLRTGKVDAMAAQPAVHRRWGGGFPLLIDPQGLPGRRAGQVIVATGRTVEHRADELRAFLRANTRAFWVMRDVANMAYLQDLRERLRAQSHNDDERYLRIVTSVEAEKAGTADHGGVVPDPWRGCRRAGRVGGAGAAHRPRRRPARRPGAGRLPGGQRRPVLEAAHRTALAAVEKYGF